MACSTVCLNEVRPGKPEQSSAEAAGRALAAGVSMKSGLEDRNNIREFFNNIDEFYEVSMKSGLEDRNNPRRLRSLWVSMLCLNEVRPGRPEQSVRNSLTTNSACTSQ